MTSLRIATRLGAMALALTMGLASAPAKAEYPDKPIRIITGFPAGGGGDILVRWYAEKLREVSGTTVIVDNKPGAGGNLGTAALVQSKPDGYSILLAPSSAIAGNVHIYKDLPFDIRKDIVPVATLNDLGFVLTINRQQMPVKNVAEFIEAIKKKGGKATFGFATTTSIAAAALFMKAAGIEATAVPYKATAAMVSDIGAGQIDFGFSDVLFTLSQEKQGKVKILAITTEKRTAAAPDVPTMAESGIQGAEIAPWWFASAPAGTPPEAIAKLAGWFDTIVRMPATRDFLVAQGADPLPGGPDFARDRLVKEIARWANIVTLTKIDPQ